MTPTGLDWPIQHFILNSSRVLLFLVRECCMLLSREGEESATTTAKLKNRFEIMWPGLIIKKMCATTTTTYNTEINKAKM